MPPQGWEVVPETPAVSGPQGWEPVAESTPQPAAPTAAQVTASDPYNSYGQLIPPQMAVGALKGALNTAAGAARLVLPQRAIDTLSALRQKTGLPPVSQMTQTTNPAQTFGKVAEQTAEYALPAAKAAELTSALKTGSGVWRAVANAAAQGGTAGAVAAAQQGQVSPSAVATGLVTAAVPIAAKPAGKVADWMGQRIENVLLKPTQAASEGLTPKQIVSKIYQYNLGGTLDQTLEKTQNAYQQTLKQLNGVLKAKPTADVDVAKAFIETADDIGASKLRTAGRNLKLDNALKGISDELNVKGLLPANGKVSLADANEIKKGIGDMGAWTRDPHGRIIIDPDASALSEVADKLYSRLKTSIEDAAPPGVVKQLNQKLSDLIAVRRAVVHRIPIDQRKNIMNLGDLLSLSTHTAWVGALNRILQSGRAANALVQGGRAAQELGTLAQPAISEGVGAVTAPLGYPRTGLVPAAAQDESGASR